jgi:putative transposase
MRGPKPAVVTLTDPERRGLDELVRRQRTPQQLALRAQIVLAAAAGENNAQIARRLSVAVDTVRAWRGRWLAFQAVPWPDLSVADRLSDAPRAGHPARLTSEQVSHIVALACAAPSASGRPLSQWSGRELAEAVMAQGIVGRISPRHVARLWKRGRSSPTASATGGPHPTTPRARPRWRIAAGCTDRPRPWRSRGSGC